MSEQVDDAGHAEVVVNRDGRILIPAQVRRDLGLAAGSALLLSVEDGRVVMESRAQLVARMRREIAEAWQGDPAVSVTDELLAERRAEAAAEDAR
ncbi:AbrB/MazE/SpoVT family DNA-binding domain-containing protein [Pseudonocardia sp. HH130629-09]|uniref:AbrB/MazE/SpoVT family DNA-binding domain-containing protein n=1 Tax=Pseudonocardia sp. HH130629-09 TaxID=1641402 RepID=UPI0006CB1F37|nr:AbrB/MazE/SpoVT family DNA-binding domain-containing protein [Pseudonocardia sp. HH130629-09]ALE86605.1 AbrB family transcriptional regulator [Pseudonocardia sp. HH130629-09]